ATTPVIGAAVLLLRIAALGGTVLRGRRLRACTLVEERSIGGLVGGALRGGVRRGCPVVLLLRGTGRVRARGARGGLIRSGPVRGGRPGAGRAGGGRVCGGRSGPACGRRVGTGRGTCIGRRTASGLD